MNVSNCEGYYSMVLYRTVINAMNQKQWFSTLYDSFDMTQSVRKEYVKRSERCVRKKGIFYTLRKWSIADLKWKSDRMIFENFNVDISMGSISKLWFRTYQQ